MVLDAFGLALLRDMAVIIAYHHAHAQENAINGFGTVVGSAKAGYVRWFNIERAMLNLLAGKYPHASVEYTQNESNQNKHVEVVTANCRLQFIHDSNPEAKVPKSDYGNLAVTNNQPLLFPNFAPPPGLADKFGAVLFHSKGEPGQLPKALSLRFPSGDYGELCAPEPLFELFEDLDCVEAVIAAYGQLQPPSHAPEEDPGDTAHPTINPASNTGS